MHGWEYKGALISLSFQNSNGEQLLVGYKQLHAAEDTHEEQTSARCVRITLLKPGSHWWDKHKHKHKRQAYARAESVIYEPSRLCACVPRICACASVNQA